MQQHSLVAGVAQRIRRGAIIGVAVIVLAACGPIGDDENKETPTSEVNVAPTELITTTEVTPEGTEPEEATTPPEDVSTPEVETAEVDSTPVETEAVAPSTPEVEVPGTPEASAETSLEATATQTTATNEPLGTPAEPESTEQPVASIPSQTGSDGTSGSTPQVAEESEPTADSADEDPASESSPSASPGAFFVREETTPDVQQPPDDGDLASVIPLSVDSCKPGEITPMPGDPVSYVTIFELNFREGPGADCSQIGDEPIAEGTDVQVVGWPVVRDGDDENIWVQVKIGNRTGWIVIDGLEPVDSGE